MPRSFIIFSSVEKVMEFYIISGNLKFLQNSGKSHEILKTGLTALSCGLYQVSTEHILKTASFACCQLPSFYRKLA